MGVMSLFIYLINGAIGLVLGYRSKIDPRLVNRVIKEICNFFYF